MELGTETPPVPTRPISEISLKINNAFSVPVPIADAWVVLTNIQEIVPCMPGAELVEVIDEVTYRGKVTTRLGPVTMTFSGTAKFEEIDEQRANALKEAFRQARRS